MRRSFCSISLDRARCSFVAPPLFICCFAVVLRIAPPLFTYCSAVVLLLFWLRPGLGPSGPQAGRARRRPGRAGPNSAQACLEMERTGSSEPLGIT